MRMGTSKNALVAGLALIILVFFALFAHQSKVAYKNKAKAEALERTVSNEGAKAEVTELKLNDSLRVMQADVEDLQITIKNLKSRYNNLLASSKIRTKYVDRVVEINTVTHDTVKTICKVDSFGGMNVKYADNYTKINVDIDSSRHAVIDYTVNDSLTIINYTKRHSLLFGLIKWNSYKGCKVITHNPKASPNTVISYDIIK